jgi:protein-disulfide isomerase
MKHDFRMRRDGQVRPNRALLCLGLIAILGIAGCGKGSDKDETSKAPPPGKVALDAESQEVAKKIQANMKDFLITNKVPSTAKVTLNYVRKAPFEGLYEASFSIEMGGQRGQRSFYFDRDAKHFVFGPVYTVGKVLRSRVDTKNMVLIDRAAKGPETAPVVIAEYSDFQCPYCGAAAGTVAALLKKYDGQVRLVFKHMPLSDMHPWAYDAAVTAECASAQKPEAFWYFHDYFYDPSKRLTRDNFKQKTEEFAKTINLDVGKLSTCVDKGDPKTRIDYDLREAGNFGFTATPTFVINDVVVVGNQPLSVFEEVIQEELQKTGKTQG